MVNHFGERTNSGHYTATTKNLIDNRWRTFDDTKVTFTEGLDICYSTNAYLLFYERRRSANWYLNSIPKSLMQLYTNVRNDNEITYTGASTFYVNENELHNNQQLTLSPSQHRLNQSTPNSSPIRSKSYQTLLNSSYNNNNGRYLDEARNDYLFNRRREFY